MDDANAANSCWSLKRSIGNLDAGTLTGRVDVAHSELGVRDLCLEGNDLTGHWFCISRDEESQVQRPQALHDENTWPLPLADAYVRGADLVAGYQPTNDWPYAPQVYWRWGPLDSLSGVITSLSLLVSVQTHLLDTFPRVAIDSRTRAKDVICFKANRGQCTESATIESEITVQTSPGVRCVVRRLSEAPLSYAEFMPASDYRELRVQRDDEGNCRAQWRLFAEFLEKGVIRRARVHAAFLRRENDMQAAMACCDAIERDSLPLTT